MKKTKPVEDDMEGFYVWLVGIGLNIIPLAISGFR